MQWFKGEEANGLIQQNLKPEKSTAINNTHNKGGISTGEETGSADVTGQSAVSWERCSRASSVTPSQGQLRLRFLPVVGTQRRGD